MAADIYEEAHKRIKNAYRGTSKRFVSWLSESIKSLQRGEDAEEELAMLRVTSPVVILQLARKRVSRRKCETIRADTA